MAGVQAEGEVTLDVVIGRTEGFVSSVGLSWDRDLILRHSPLMWVGRDEKLRVVKRLITFCERITAKGVKVTGVEKLRALVKEMEK